MFRRIYILLGFSILASMGVSASNERELGYVGGFSGPEDLVAIPETRWIIAGGLGDAEDGGALYLIDGVEKESVKLFPDNELSHDFQTTLYPACPSLIDPDNFSAHGINLSVDQDGTAYLYVVNHGSREAIEVFRVSYSESDAELAWVGCVPLPEGSMANGVAPLSDHGLTATLFFAPEYFADGNPKEDHTLWMQKLKTGQPTGYAATWSRSEGWKKIQGTESSGPNGIEVSPEDEWVWVAKWGNKKIAKIALSDNSLQHVIDLDFMPDNLRWGDDGMLWVAGASGDASEYFSCVATPDCHSEFVIAKINPESHAVEMIKVPDNLTDFGDATTAVVVDGTVWVGANPSNRVLYFQESRKH